MYFNYNGKRDTQFAIEKEFTFPSFAKSVQYRDSNHSSFRRRLRHTFTPLTIPIPIVILEKENGIELSRDDLVARLNRLLYSDGEKILKLDDTNWYMVGEFQGPFNIPTYFSAFLKVDVEFVSQYSHKFYDGERVQTAAKTATISTKSQIPTTPLIELTGLTGNDVQISRSRELENGDIDSERIRLTGNLPSNLTIDIENERIYEPSSGVNRINLLRIDSAFEDFRIENGDVVVLTNAGSNARAKLTYKELLL